MEKNEIKEALHEYRREKKEAKQADKIWMFILVEILICAALLGLNFGSEMIFFLVLIGGGICYFLPIIGVIICVLLSGFWGIVVWWICWYANNETGSFAAIVVGIIAFAVSLGIHLYPRYSDAFYRNY
ncbi:hypothetical protein [Metabacillus litoralis]|uniref:hypothetical protein n=1 Tax=Metabacillus litoralis TaxID=152268 RepID=UPI0020409838|nr:hypothetical protein [Metabacillus litoralis]MCM3412654.1 hypothetical protein [Metabacillus litoralis]